MSRLRSWLVAGFLLQYVLLAYFCVVAEGVEELAATKGRQLAGVSSNNWLAEPEQDVLVVSLLDGRVVAVDTSTGSVLWTFDSGAPLVSVKQSESAPSGLNIFPGVDGGLYAYHGLENEQAKLERLPITLPELVEASPSLTDDGSVIIGKRASTVFLLDRDNGRLVRMLSDMPGGVEDRAADVLKLVEPESMLVVGREDYIVRSLQASDGRETWNATFSRMMRLQPPQVGPPTAAAAAAASPFSLGAPATTSPASAAPLGSALPLPHFTVAADNTLQAWDAKTGFRRWAISFDTPPVAAYSANGGGNNHLDPAVKHPPLPGLAKNAAAPVGHGGAVVGPHRQHHSGSSRLPGGSPVKVEGALDHRTRVLVGALGSSLYVMPADHLLLQEGDHSALHGWGQHMALPDASRPAIVSGALALEGRVNEVSSTTSTGTTDSDASDASDATATALAVVRGTPGDTHVVALVNDRGDNASHVVNSLVCPPGLHSVNSTPADAHQLSWLPSPSTLRSRNTSNGAVSGDSQSIFTQGPWASVGLLLGSFVTGILVLLAVSWLLKGKAAFAGAAFAPVPSNQVPTPMQAQYMANTPHMGNGDAHLTGDSSNQSNSSSTSNNKSKKKGKARAVSCAYGLEDRPLRGDAHAADALSSNGNVADSNHFSDHVNHNSGSNHSNNMHSKANQSDGFNGAALASRADIGWAHNGDMAHAPAAGACSIGTPAEAAAAAAAALSSSSAPAATSEYAPLSSAAGNIDSTRPAGGGIHQTSTAGVDRSRLARLQPDGALVIGRLRVGPAILGYGSAGTIVYEGVLDGRAVAVKRLLRQFYDLAKKEIEVLILSDEHPNVVRCFAMEEDREFVYLALERCRSTLSDFLATPQGRAAFVENGRPTSRCFEAMHEIAQGLAALHERGIVHRDLKPHNVLITEGNRIKLSDMGLSKQLVAEQSSFESHGAAASVGVVAGSGGSSGWQAPEQLIARNGGVVRQTRSMDVFSLGCVLYFCITGGSHPFGNSYERDTNILRSHPNLLALQSQPEVLNLLAPMLHKDATARPSMAAVLAHPLWWSPETKLQFLADISNRVEPEDREPDPSLLNALEMFSGAAFGANWGSIVAPELIANLGRYRRYDFSRLRDLLRTVRNKKDHFYEMPQQLQELLGPLPTGYLTYFTLRFPNLFMAVFIFAVQQLYGKPSLARYWSVEQASYEPFAQAFFKLHAAKIRSTTTQPPLPSPPKPATATAATAAAAVTAAAAAAAAAAGITSAAVVASGSTLSSVPEDSLVSSSDASRSDQARAAAAAAQLLPSSSKAPCNAAAGSSQTDGMPPASGTYSAVPDPPSMWSTDSPRHATTASAPTATSAAEATPAAPAGSASDAQHSAPSSLPIVGYEVDDDDNSPTHVREFPSRPGKQLCDFFIKTGHCKFGDTCVFDHPEQYAVRLNKLGYPMRPDAPVCAFYLKHNECRFGPACKFHHPKLRPILAGSAVAQP